MIRLASRLLNGTRLQTEVCIVGSGPAGIALALALSERSIKVLMLESGLPAEDKEAQGLDIGEVVEENLHSPPDKYRLRGMGGASAIWGGSCVPFDRLDFETRPHVPGSGWPISYDDLFPYYVQANELVEAGSFNYSAEETLGSDAAPLIRGFDSDCVRTDSLERFSNPSDFGKRYADRLKLSRTITVLLGATCTAVRLEPDGHSVRELEVKTPEGLGFSVAARMHVIAAGGLETPRLLLASRDITPRGVGNGHDVVGRYYMCHISASVGVLSLAGSPGEVRNGYEKSPEGVYCRRRISLGAAQQKRLGVANAVARLHFPRMTDPIHHNGVLSGLFLARKLVSYEYAKRLDDGSAASFIEYARQFMDGASDPVSTTAFLTHWVAKHSLANRKFPPVILRNRNNLFALEVLGEQIPRAASRVLLSDQADPLGIPQLRIDWRYGPDDIESMRRTLDLLAAEFARSGVGRFDYNQDTLEQDLMRFGAYGGHHIGTARMGSDPQTSVVNADCQVHGVANLFVAGCAVFPTSSQANPTLTLVALSLRLAGRLSVLLGAERAVVSPPASAAEPGFSDCTADRLLVNK